MTATNDSLNRIEVASPCTQSWDAMRGDEKSRFCGECRLHVHNLSAMTSGEAQNLLGNADGRLCVRYFKRADGTVLTQDCVPVRKRVQRRLRRLRVAAAALFGFLGPLGLAACGDGGGATDNGGDPAGGEPGALVDPGTDPELVPLMGEPLMGDVLLPEEELQPLPEDGEDADTGALTPEEIEGIEAVREDEPPRETIGRMIVR